MRKVAAIVSPRLLPLILVAFLSAGAALRAQPRPPGAAPAQGARPVPAAQKSLAPPQGAFEVYEWVVLVCDASIASANAERLFQSTAPEFVGSRRPAAPASSGGEPSPMGVIRLRGEDEGAKVDVLLQAPTGRFLGQWPKAKGRTNRQLWEAFELHRAAPPGVKEIPAGHWFGALREGDALYVQRARTAERFLLYDVELNYPLPIHVSGGKGLQYEVANSGGAAVHDLTLYKPQEGAWRTGAVASLGAAKDAPPAATRPASQPAATAPATGPARAAAAAQQVAAALRARRGAVPGADPTELPAAPPPATQPSPGAAKAAVAADAPAAAAVEVLSAWKQRLVREGLPEGDIALVLRILEKHALDKRRLTAVYRLDPAELDRILPLEVTPSPRKTVRVGLVIARNIDPSVADEIDQLIARLGDPDWDQREAAQKQLAELGPAARAKLQASLQNKDLEVVWRAERLLQSLEAQPASARQR